MKKILQRLLLVLGVAFIVIQFLGPAKTNPPVDEAKTILAGTPVPAEIAGVLNRACYDCHSNQTRWPWYSNVAPVSWFVIDHVNEARKELNFSEWAAYSPKRMKRKLEEIKDEVEEGSMPLKSYLPLHPDAKLLPEDVHALTAWAVAERERLVQADSLAKK